MEFASKSQYDDYLEEREDIIYNLIEGLEVEEMEAKIAAYQRENRENILQNDARKAEEARARAQRASGSAKTASTAPSTSAPTQQPEDATKYNATAVMPAAPPPAQPAPRQAATAAAGLSGDDPGSRERIARASGWDPNFQHDRLLQEAYSTIFLRPLPSPAGQLVE
ncbi:hypothetical protein COCSUDRAFT_59138 [Coccomyxa subellipsoidea C-169]|uniref:MAT1 centre domain-containing protein n=1 Tax=Coccomyxa subellipsoidea (strain C-169) TaxID=574566 RepID=I0Z7J7_COCSC|nr:hypothetical protein COCSUDRAFT_59138 [Coccomyxa subellipsoidea C-169]EIE26616.1 hypothetical protein COCSUDRAFT_59138 [Coccomyxa subellipsoidea C-169]|eukprot:XP_005651160.1 hypothetical protein COCSUDRAFT_59138 [Coccomyxa subellipsoidea C-169]